jgi:hypothetical protein
MSCGHHARESTLFDERRDPFAAALGAGRGLSAAQQAVLAQTEAAQARAFAAAAAPRPFSRAGEDDTTVVEYFRDNDVRAHLYREDGPSRVITMPDGARTEEYWADGYLQSDERPVRVKYRADGTLSSQEWRAFKGEIILLDVDQAHREDGPAVLTDDVDGTHTEKWYYRGELHREDGPAVVIFYTTAATALHAKGVYVEQYFIKGQQHRERGPAEIKYRVDGSIAARRWFRNGEELSPRRWRRALGAVERALLRKDIRAHIRKSGPTQFEKLVLP